MAGPYVVCNVSSNDFALRNMLYVSRGDRLEGQSVVMWQMSSSGAKLKAYPGIYLVGVDASLQAPLHHSPDARALAVSGPIRKVAGLSNGDSVGVEVVSGLKPATLVMLQVTKLKPAGVAPIDLDADQLQPSAKQLVGFPVAIHSPFIRSILDMYITCTATAITVDGDPRAVRAVITNSTEFVFEAGHASVHITGQAAMTNLFKHGDFDVQSLGIGGLDDQFAEIFRGAFASRAAPPDVMRKMNFQHTKGILLYGPPGTGKTLIARQIGKLLNAVEPKVVNGPEILDKFVGESEKKVRELFADAEADQAAKGDASPLHVIIFDEIDAICKARGTTGGGTGVHDSIVNTLLTKIDGVESLNNILLIGMTNRPDLLDDALVRPGRMELKIEIGLPDEKGRLQILEIHTKSMQENDYLSSDVDLRTVAAQTRNFTGAELQAVIRKATNWALEDVLDKSKLTNVGKDLHPVVAMRHFKQVLDHEIKPAFGAAHDTIASYYARGMYNFGPRFMRIMEDVPAACELTADDPKRTILLTGEAGTGKTALAAYVASQMDAPFIKVVDYGDVMGKPEAAITDVLKKAFDDAYKSPKSVLILDDVGALIHFAKHGTRYNLAALLTLKHLLHKAPPPGKEMVVICTADAYVTDTLELSKSFSKTTSVPMLTRDEAVFVLQDCGLCDSQQLLQGAVALLPEATHFDASISRLAILLRACTVDGRLDLDTMERWVETLNAAY